MRQLFASGWYDEESGLYWLRTRFMDPQVGRFMERDPAGVWFDGASMGNGYTYAANNPGTMVDPLGMYSLPGDSFTGTPQHGGGMFGSRPWWWDVCVLCTEVEPATTSETSNEEEVDLANEWLVRSRAAVVSAEKVIGKGLAIAPVDYRGEAPPLLDAILGPYRAWREANGHEGARLAATVHRITQHDEEAYAASEEDRAHYKGGQAIAMQTGDDAAQFVTDEVTSQAAMLPIGLGAKAARGGRQLVVRQGSFRMRPSFLTERSSAAEPSMFAPRSRAFRPAD